MRKRITCLTGISEIIPDRGKKKEDINVIELKEQNGEVVVELELFHFYLYSC